MHFFVKKKLTLQKAVKELKSIENFVSFKIREVLVAGTKGNAWTLYFSLSVKNVF